MDLKIKTLFQSLERLTGKKWISATWCRGMSLRGKAPDLSLGCINSGARSNNNKYSSLPTSCATEAKHLAEKLTNGETMKAINGGFR